MPSTIQSFFATIDPVSPPPYQLWNFAFRQNQSHRDETFKLKLLRWRRRVLPPGLPAVHSKFQRHRLATRHLYAPKVAQASTNGAVLGVRQFSDTVTSILESNPQP